MAGGWEVREMHLEILFCFKSFTTLFHFKLSAYITWEKNLTYSQFPGSPIATEKDCEQDRDSDERGIFLHSEEGN